MWHPSKLRIGLSCTLFASVLFMAPWFAALIAIALSARWRAWEVVFAGMLMDVLWLPFAASVTTVQGLPIATMLSIVVVVALEPLRRQLLLGSAIL